MKNVILKSVLVVAAAMSLMVGNAMALQIGMDLDWTPGSTPTDVIVDNGSMDANTMEGWITSASPHVIGDWMMSSNGLNLQTLGTSSGEELDLNTISLTSAAGGDVWLLLAEVDLTGEGWVGRVGGTTDGTVDFFAMITEGNEYWSAGQIVASASFDAQGVDNAEFALSGSWDAVGDEGAYSMLLGAHIHHDGAGNTSFDMAASQVPEPATMLLFGTGLIGLAGYRRQKSKETKKV